MSAQSQTVRVSSRLPARWRRESALQLVEVDEEVAGPRRTAFGRYGGGSSTSRGFTSWRASAASAICPSIRASGAPRNSECRRRSRGARCRDDRDRSGREMRTALDHGFPRRGSAGYRPARDRPPPISMSASAKRVTNCTGGSKRSTSSTTIGARSGWSRNRSISAG